MIEELLYNGTYEKNLLYNSSFYKYNFRLYSQIIVIVDKFGAFAHIPKKTLHLQGGMIES